MSGARPWLRSESIRCLERGVAERDHPALARRQLLVGVEAEHGRMSRARRRQCPSACTAPSASQASSTIASPCLSRDPLEGGHVGRVAEDVHRQQRPRALGDGGRGGLRIEVERHRVDVREHRPRPLVERGVGRGDERERAGDDLVAVPHPDRPQRQMQPGRAAATRRSPSGAPTRAAKARSNSGTRGPSESCPERSTSSTARSSASPSTGRARAGSARRLTTAVRTPSARPGADGAGLHPVLERVHQRIPGGGDHVLGDPDRAPHLLPVGGVDQHPRDGAGALRLIEDPHLEVDELDVPQMRVDLADRLAQRAGRARSPGRCPRPCARSAPPSSQILIVASVSHLAVGPLLDDHAPGLQAEQRLVVAGLPAHQQLEGAVRGLELEALVLELLDALDHALGELLVGGDPGLARLLGDRAAARRARRRARRGRCRRAPGRCARRSARRRARRRRAGPPCGRRRACRHTAGRGWARG